VRNFCHYQSSNAVLLLGKCESVSIIYSWITSHRNIQVDRDVRRTHHLLLHPTEGEITKKTVNQAPGTDDSKTQPIGSTSSIARSVMVAHVQTVQAEVPRAACVLLTTA
jgi:hypothetical protein